LSFEAGQRVTIQSLLGHIYICWMETAQYLVVIQRTFEEEVLGI
jgi:hypothetical protein